MIRYLSKILKSIIGQGWFYLFIYNAAYIFKAKFIVAPNLKRLFKKSISTKIIDESKPLIVVPILEMNHHMNFHVLGIAKAFSIRGFDVLVIVCDEYLPACEIKSCRTPPNSNPCFKCNTNRKYLLNLFGLKTLTLSSIFSSIENPVEYGKKVIKDYGLDQSVINRTIEDSVTRHFYGAEDSFPEKYVLKTKQKHVDTAFMSLALGRLLLEDYSPSICLNIMSSYSAWGPICYFFESVGVAPIMMSQTQFDIKSVRFNNPDLFRHKRTYQRFLSARGNYYLKDTERKALLNFMNIRKSGNDPFLKKWYYFKDAVDTKLAINKDKKNVYLFTNVPWDVGLNEFAGPFEGVIDWVYQTIEYFKDNKEIDIWIKPHPEEVLSASNSMKSVSDFVREKYPLLPSNIHIIEPTLGINTYNLFQYIDVGVILTGTLGLEMALDGIPVVSAGINPSYGLGLLSEPKDIDSYFDAIISSDTISYNKKQLELFCYFYFIHQSFRWPLSNKSFGDNFSGFTINHENQLKPGKTESVDAILNEIKFLVADYKENYINNTN